MSHDFAKIRPEPLLDKKPVAAPPAWSLMFTGVIVGLALGVFACVVFYLSGNVPPLGNQVQAPLTVQNPSDGNSSTQVGRAELPADEQALNSQQINTIATAVNNETEEKPELTFDFYDVLPNSEVKVDATPVELTAEQAARLGLSETPDAVTALGSRAGSQAQVGLYMLQSGAFQQLQSAETQRNDLETLGLTATVKQQAIAGRTLYLVQTGPYANQAALVQAEQLLRSANVNSMRISLR